jgi:N utilization substance protein A
MGSELFQAMEQMGREKGIDVETIIEAVQDAVVAASKKHFRTREELVSEFDRDRGTWNIYAVKKVVDDVEDSDLEISVDDARRVVPNVTLEQSIWLLKPKVDLGRIAAQAAKQVIYQKVREAERDNVYKEYCNRVGELINGVVKRFERGDLVLDLGRTESLLPRREQSRADHYNQDDRVRGVIINVDRAARGPQVIISRTDTRLLLKLFEMEVPEIYDGTVVIENIARDPGDRAKVAVRSNEKDIDPVGACVGIKGSRVQAIIRELRGEKIDIVQWSDESMVFVANALNPASVGRVTIIDEQEKVLEVTVEDSQLSQAIGKKGQNVRLASQLVGWRIEIKSESDKKKEIEREITRMARATSEIRNLPGVGEKVATSLMDAGFRSLEEIVAAAPEALAGVPGLGEKTISKMQEAAQTGIVEREAQLAREAEERRIREEKEAEERKLLAEKKEQERQARVAAGLPEEEPPAESETDEPASDAAGEAAAAETTKESESAASQTNETAESAAEESDPASVASQDTEGDTTTSESESSGDAPPADAAADEAPEESSSTNSIDNDSASDTAAGESESGDPAPAKTEETTTASDVPSEKNDENDAGSEPSKPAKEAKLEG